VAGVPVVVAAAAVGGASRAGKYVSKQ